MEREGERYHQQDILSKLRIKTVKKIKILSHQTSNPLQLKEDALHPIATLMIVPFFALGNASVIIDSSMLA